MTNNHQFTPHPHELARLRTLPPGGEVMPVRRCLQSESSDGDTYAGCILDESHDGECQRDQAG